MRQSISEMVTSKLENIAIFSLSNSEGHQIHRTAQVFHSYQQIFQLQYRFKGPQLLQGLLTDIVIVSNPHEHTLEGGTTAKWLFLFTDKHGKSWV